MISSLGNEIMETLVATKVKIFDHFTSEWNFCPETRFITRDFRYYKYLKSYH